jgi:hypothetical protein
LFLDIGGAVRQLDTLLCIFQEFDRIHAHASS